MKTAIICLLALIASNNLFSQSEFKNGYIILLNGDTVFGQIDNKSYRQNSLDCFFKKTPSDSIIKYTPEQITGYRFTDGKYYVSKNIESKNIHGKYFLEYLINGKLKVYLFLDKEKENHYFIETDTLPLRELKYGEKNIYVNDNTYIQNSRHFAIMLNYYTRDCPSLKEDIDHIDQPDHKNLIKIAEKYHYKMCNNQNCMIYEKKACPKIKMGLYAGFNFFLINNLDIDQKIAPMLGINFLFQQLTANERFYIGLGLLYSGKIGDNNFIQIPLSMCYIHPKEGLSPYFAYDLDLRYVGFIEEIKIGLKYQITDVSILLTTDVKTVYFIKPFAIGAHFGLLFDLQ